MGAYLLLGAATTLCFSACSLLLNTDGITGGTKGDAAGGDDGLVDTGSGPALDSSFDATDEPWLDGDGSESETLDVSETGESTQDAEPSDADASIDSAASDAAPEDGAPGDAVARDSAPGDGSSCPNDLSNIGTADFSIMATVTNRQTGLVAFTNQRPTCNPTMFWDVRLSSGNLRVETADGVTRLDMTSAGVLVNDGRAHAVLVARTNKVVHVIIDGMDAGWAPSGASFAMLPPLEAGTDPCEGHDTTSPFVGTLRNLCVSSP